MSFVKEGPHEFGAGPGAARHGYDPGFLAEKHGITRAEAEQLIKSIGNDAEKLDQAAERLKRTL